jgi:predicted DNA binding CopG/RHH family protein
MSDEGQRRVNLKLPEELHHRMRVLVAKRATTVQAFLTDLIEKEVKESPRAPRFKEGQR